MINWGDFRDLGQKLELPADAGTPHIVPQQRKVFYGASRCRIPLSPTHTTSTPALPALFVERQLSPDPRSPRSPLLPPLLGADAEEAVQFWRRSSTGDLRFDFKCQDLAFIDATDDEGSSPVKAQFTVGSFDDRENKQNKRKERDEGTPLKQALQHSITNNKADTNSLRVTQRTK